MNNGPIMVGFVIYNDFPSYRSGIYEVTSGASVIGGHAVILIGWGYSDNRLYWIGQN